jgi:hypothetical protein
MPPAVETRRYAATDIDANSRHPTFRALVQGPSRSSLIVSLRTTLSLVVVHATPDGPRIVGDTKVSFRDSKRSRYRTDTLKVVVLNQTTVVCFAGEVDRGLAAVRSCAQLLSNSPDEDQILRELVRISSDTRRATEFLLVRGDDSRQIARVSQGKVEPNLATAWIGDASAFARFQSAFHTVTPFDALLKKLPPGPQTMSRLSRAIDAVIDDPQIDSVGNLAVRVALTEGGFNYLSSAFTMVERDFVIETTPGEWVDVPLIRPVEEGGFAVSVVEPAAPGTPAMGLSFPQPNIAMLYLPLQFDEAEVMLDVAPNAFRAVVLERYGIAMSDPTIRRA